MVSLPLAKSLPVAAYQCLMLSDVQQKLDCTLRIREQWCCGGLSLKRPGEAHDACLAGLPEELEFVPFNRLPKRSLTSKQGHAALIHSFLHIECNAINIAWDAVYRFQHMPDAFYDDWSRIAAEEAYHFRLLQDYLLTLGYDYGSFPVHGGLWQMVEQTRSDVMLRMALVPRVLEARGLDVSPGIIRRFRAHEMDEAADILQIIYQDEIGHVAIGTKWFNTICKERGLDSHATFENLINTYAIDKIRQPFDLVGREKAGFSQREMKYLHALEAKKQ
ncbi:MAG TPA: ferritin-like domain-containing protein [Gammaproteobacteria bacterium]|nr:ferritin-like domain-containing protein [Gammaproteobacteria bacterium]